MVSSGRMDGWSEVGPAALPPPAPAVCSRLAPAAAGRPREDFKMRPPSLDGAAAAASVREKLSELGRGGMDSQRGGESRYSSQEVKT